MAQSGGSLIGERLGDFVSPRKPTRHEFPSEEFQTGAGAGSFDHLTDRIRFLAVATARGLDPTAQARGAL
jgi:hypothetical protein